MQKIINHTGTVHYTADGTIPACGPVATHKSWMRSTVTQVSCQHCIAKFGEDNEYGEDPNDEYTLRMVRRAAERAARQAARV